MVSHGTVSVQLSDKSWSVDSSTKLQTYIVKQLKDICTCQLRCNTCHTCVHTFTCSCADVHLTSTVCKHVHVVSLFKASSNQISSVSPTEV